MSQNNGKSIFSNLWERRLPQFFATYIGICWGFVQFLTFACSRYGFQDSLIDKFLLFAAVLIPGVLLYIYNHGKPGKDSFTKLEKFFLPSNIVVAPLLAFLVGGYTKLDGLWGKADPRFIFYEEYNALGNRLAE